MILCQVFIRKSEKLISTRCPDRIGEGRGEGVQEVFLKKESGWSGYSRLKSKDD